MITKMLIVGLCLFLVSAKSRTILSFLQEDIDEDYEPYVSPEDLEDIYSISENIDRNIEHLEALDSYLSEDEAVLIMGNYRDHDDMKDAIYVYEAYKEYSAEENPVEVFVFEAADYDMDAFFMAEDRDEDPNLEDYKIVD